MSTQHQARLPGHRTLRDVHASHDLWVLELEALLGILGKVVVQYGLDFRKQTKVERRKPKICKISGPSRDVMAKTSRTATQTRPVLIGVGSGFPHWVIVTEASGCHKRRRRVTPCSLFVVYLCLTYKGFFKEVERGVFNIMPCVQPTRQDLITLINCLSIVCELPVDMNVSLARGHCSYVLLSQK